MPAKNSLDFLQAKKLNAIKAGLKVEGQEALVGITAFAQSELGKIVYVDLPSIGAQFNKEMKCLVL